MDILMKFSFDKCIQYFWFLGISDVLSHSYLLIDDSDSFRLYARVGKLKKKHAPAAKSLLLTGELIL